jgi:hypothetical protein
MSVAAKLVHGKYASFHIVLGDAVSCDATRSFLAHTVTTDVEGVPVRLRCGRTGCREHWEGIGTAKEPKPICYRTLLRKCVEHVAREEGSAFLGTWRRQGRFTDREWEELLRIAMEIE